MAAELGVPDSTKAMPSSMHLYPVEKCPVIIGTMPLKTPVEFIRRGCWILRCGALPLPRSDGHSIADGA